MKNGSINGDCSGITLNGRPEEVLNGWFYPNWLQEMDLQCLLWKQGVIFTDNVGFRSTQRRQCSHIFISIWSFLYLEVYFTVSLLGNANYFFFSCHLPDVAISFKTLATIVQAVTHNGKQIGHTLLHSGSLAHHVVVWCRPRLTSCFTDPPSCGGD